LPGTRGRAEGGRGGEVARARGGAVISSLLDDIEAVAPTGTPTAADATPTAAARGGAGRCGWAFPPTPFLPAGGGAYAPPPHRHLDGPAPPRRRAERCRRPALTRWRCCWQRWRTRRMWRCGQCCWRCFSWASRGSTGPGRRLRGWGWRWRRRLPCRQRRAAADEGDPLLPSYGSRTGLRAPRRSGQRAPRPSASYLP